MKPSEKLKKIQDIVIKNTGYYAGYYPIWLCDDCRLILRFAAASTGKKHSLIFRFAEGAITCECCEEEKDSTLIKIS